MLKKLLLTVGALVVLIPILAIGWLYYSTEKNMARPTDDALQALVSDTAVQVETGDWIVMRPTTGEPTRGVIVYPGANCDIRGYAPLLKPIAGAGYLVVAVSMPFDFAIFAPDSATDVREAYPFIEEWVLVGHSMGGAMAGRYAFHHEQELAGLVFWDSYPPKPNDLSDSSLPIMHIHRGTLDGAPPQKFQDMRHLFPGDSRWVAIPGGIHMYFGSFNGGGYDEEWEPKISRERQQQMIIAATLDWLQRVPSSM